MKRFKHFISEGKTKGVDYEIVIVNAWNCFEAGSNLRAVSFKTNRRKGNK